MGNHSKKDLNIILFSAKLIANKTYEKNHFFTSTLYSSLVGFL